MEPFPIVIRRDVFESVLIGLGPGGEAFAVDGRDVEVGCGYSFPWRHYCLHKADTFAYLDLNH